MEQRTTPVAVRRRDLLRTLAASGFAVGVAGCASGDGGSGGDGGEFEPQGPGDREYVSGTTSSAQNLSPLSIGDEATDARISLFYDGGGDVNDDPIAFESRWFENWELSDDAQTVRYTLRDDLEWGADYGQLTAEDYLYSVRNVFTADWAQFSQRSFFVLGGEPIQYERTGTLSFEASLPQPRANWLHEDPLLGSLPLPKALVQKYEPAGDGGGDGNGDSPRQQLDADPDVANAALAGNLGPFTFESWEKGQKLVVSADDDYYLAETDVEDGAFRESPQLDGVTIQVFDEQSTAYSALKAGDITTAGIEERKVSEFEAVDGVKLWSTQFGEGIFWLNVNHRVNGWPPLRESREVRQALAHLFDRGTLVDQIFDGYGSPAHTFHPTWGPYYDEEEIAVFEPDVETAREKLERGTSSDYGYDGDGTFRGPDGEQVELKLVIDNTTQQGEILGNFLRTRFDEAGIALDITGLPFGEILQTFFANSVGNNPNYSGDPDYGPVSQYNGGPPDQAISEEPWDLLYGAGFSTGAYAPWQVVKGFLTRQGAFNAVGYVTEEFDIDGAVSEAASAASQEEATGILAELFGFLSRDQPVVWGFTEYNIAGYRQPVQGLPEVTNFFSRPNVRLLSLATQS